MYKRTHFREVGCIPMVGAAGIWFGMFVNTLFLLTFIPSDWRGDYISYDGNDLPKDVLAKLTAGHIVDGCIQILSSPSSCPPNDKITYIVHTLKLLALSGFKDDYVLQNIRTLYFIIMSWLFVSSSKPKQCKGVWQLACLFGPFQRFFHR